MGSSGGDQLREGLQAGDLRYSPDKSGRYAGLLNLEVAFVEEAIGFAHYFHGQAFERH